MRTKLFLPLLLIMVMLVSACGSTANSISSTSGSGKDPSSIHVAFVGPTSSQDFAVEMADGAQYAANQFHVQAQIVATPVVDNPGEVKLFQDVTRTATDGVAVFTLAPNLFVRPEAQAISQGIPLIAVDVNGLPGSGITTFVGNDNVGAGKIFADELLSKLPANPSGDVVVGVPGLGTPPLVQRANGAIAELKAKAPGIHIIGPFNTNPVVGDQTENFNEWNNIVRAHPNALAYFGTGNSDAVSLAKIKQTNNGKYLTGGFDLEAASLQGVLNGVNFALLDPEHFLKGYIAMRLLIQHALHGTAIPKGWWNPGSIIVDQSNVQEVINRQASVNTRGTFFTPTINAEFADPSKYIQPLS